MTTDFLTRLAKVDGYILREKPKSEKEYVSLKSGDGRDIVLNVNGLRTSHLVQGTLERLLWRGHVVLNQKNDEEGWERYSVTGAGLQAHDHGE